MNGKLSVGLCIAAGLYVASAGVLAADKHPGTAQGASTQTYNAQVSFDSGQDRDSQLGAQLDASDSTSFDLLAEETSSPAGRNDLVTHTYDLGWDQGLGDSTGFGLRYDWSGKQQALVSRALYGSFYLKNASWEATVLPGYRRSTLYNRTGKPITVSIPIEPITTPEKFRKLVLPPSLDINDKPLGAKLDYTAVEDWSFEISSTRHDYDRQHVGFLVKYLGRDLATGSALTLQQSFLLHENSARIERDFDLTSLAVDYEVDQSAVDRSWSYTTDLDFQTPIGEAFDIEITAGATHSLSLPQTRFVTLNLIYYR